MKQPYNDTTLLELYVLSTFRDSKMPLGAGTIEETLLLRDICISEAGVGRLLRFLRQKGYLEKKGFQGHIITKLGTDHLKKLEIEKKYSDILNNISNTGKDFQLNILDILVARRALEREITYQAALKASPNDIEALEIVVSAQYKAMEKRENCTEYSMAFHRKLLDIAKSPMLRDLYNLIGHTLQWHNFFVEVFKMYHLPLNVSHEQILQAIRDKEPELASILMGKHITNVIDNAEDILNSNR